MTKHGREFYQDQERLLNQTLERRLLVRSSCPQYDGSHLYFSNGDCDEEKSKEAKRRRKLTTNSLPPSCFLQIQEVGLISGSLDTENSASSSQLAQKGHFPWSAMTEGGQHSDSPVERGKTSKVSSLRTQQPPVGEDRRWNLLQW